MDMNTIDKYFNKPPSEWHVLGFFRECSIEPFRQKIGCYLKSLRSIANTETGQRREKALNLLDLYTKASFKVLHKKGDCPDKTKVKKWKIERAQQVASIRGETDNRKRKKIEDYFPRGNATAHLPSQDELTHLPSQNELTHLPSQNELTHLPSQDELIQENSENQVPFRFDREISPSISTMDSSYLPSSSSSTVDEEFIKTDTPNDLTCYFTGLGDTQWHLNENSIRWIVNNIDISEKCVEYRRLVIEKCKAMTVTLNAIEEL
ncbi:hypothetical protein F8M41_026044 [Gigaspora margarita]|uniref:Uncharacterized protein n=1 Tax=Gigaspora margarita TaxID=4874 RepID=A0A8H3XJE4_GIGMA|nr:hypothetical protein F8M41_026044 [Gigaspora margarita]